VLATLPDHFHWLLQSALTRWQYTLGYRGYDLDAVREV